jgi:uncharacterized membrane protein (UPF0127 family)
MLALLLLWGLLTTLGCATSLPEAATTASTSTREPEQPMVSIGNATYSVDLAVLPEERTQGLSGREHMTRDTGMLFVFEEERQLHFWMKEMRFPLDIIWIDAQCRLLEVAVNVPTPQPDASNEEIPRVQSPSPARYVLEVNAGETERNGLAPGDLVEFRGAIAGKYGC